MTYDLTELDRLHRRRQVKPTNEVDAIAPGFEQPCRTCQGHRWVCTRCKDSIDDCECGDPRIEPCKVCKGRGAAA